MSTVYLHIGTPKTGTTALQNFLPLNEEVLEQHGICYADLGMRYENVGQYRNAHFLVPVYLEEDGETRDHAREDADYAQGLAKVAELAKRFPRIILSDEGIWKGCEEHENFWPNLKKDFEERGLDLKIIVYFRRQDLWVQSHWAQKVKEGALYDFEGYLNDPVYLEYPLDYYAYMNMLSGLFGKDALIIRVYEKGQFRGPEHTIHSDFLDIFGLTLSDGFTIKQEIYNTSLEGDYLEMKRVLNANPDFQPNKHPLIRTIKSIQDQKLFDYNYTKKSFFTYEDQLAFLKKYEEGNRGVARDYLGREDGVLFYEPVKNLPKWEVDERNLVRDTLFLYGKITDTQLKKNKQYEEKLSKLDAQLKKLKEETKEKDRAIQKELREEVKSIRQDLIWFRFKRKVRHLLGKDKQPEA